MKITDEDIKMLKVKANEVRKDILEEVYNAGCGHPGGALSIADILTVLYFNHMNIDPNKPDDLNRDRLVLSKGHSSPALYAVLAERGYFNKEELKNFRKLGSYLQGHPDMKKVPGVDMSSGSLGQGLSVANGMAIASKLDGKGYKVYCILGDGELEEGQVWEAAMTSAKYNLDNVCVIVDNNNLQIDGTIDSVKKSVYPIKEKFESFGFNVFEVDGHDIDAIISTLQKVKEVKNMPSVIIAKTIKGKGVSYMENVASWHGKAPNEEEYNKAMEELNNMNF